MTNDTSLDSLLNEFLSYTLSIEKSVLEEESEPEEWNELLDKRQVVIESVSSLLAQGAQLTDVQKINYLQPAYEVDQIIVPIMEQKKKKLELEMMNMRRSQEVNQQYGDYGNAYSPYGAFFDKKK